MKKISILIALILILGFTVSANADNIYSVINKNNNADGELKTKHVLTYKMAKEMLKYPKRKYSIKDEEILASYIWPYKIDNIHNIYYLNYHFWLGKAHIQKFFHNINQNMEYYAKHNQLSTFTKNFYHYLHEIHDNKLYYNSPYLRNYYVKYLPVYKKLVEKINK